MRTFKSIERPSQALGIDLDNLFLVMGFALASGLIVGGFSLFMSLHWLVYVLFLVAIVGLFILFKFLAKHRPPGFAMGFVSYHLRQPKRLTIGLPRNAKARAAAKAKMIASERKPAAKVSAKAKPKAAALAKN